MSMVSSRASAITRRLPPDPIYTPIDKTSRIVGHSDVYSLQTPQCGGVIPRERAVFSSRSSRSAVKNIFVLGLDSSLQHFKPRHNDFREGRLTPGSTAG